MTPGEISQFFAARDAIWRRHGYAMLAEDHAEDGEVESPVGGKVKGKAAIQNIYEEWFSSFPDVQCLAEHLLIDGDRAV